MKIVFRGVLVDVDYDLEGGQPEIIRPDPNDSQEGIDPTVTINSVKAGKEEIGPLFDDDMEIELIDELLKELKARQS